MLNNQGEAHHHHQEWSERGIIVQSGALCYAMWTGALSNLMHSLGKRNWKCREKSVREHVVKKEHLEQNKNSLQILGQLLFVTLHWQQ